MLSRSGASARSCSCARSRFSGSRFFGSRFSGSRFFGVRLVSEPATVLLADCDTVGK